MMRVSIVLLALVMACDEKPRPASHGVNDFRMRGRALADLIRERVEHPSADLEARIRKEALMFCHLSDGPDGRATMQRLLDAGMTLDELYPPNIASEARFVRCLLIQLRTGEIVEFNAADRTWTRTGRYEPLLP